MFSPKSKKTHTVASVLNDAIDISSPDLCNTDYCLHDDTSTVVAVATSPAEKNVNFDLLQTEEFDTNPSHILDDEMVAKLWYSEDERMSIKLNRDNALDFGLQKKNGAKGTGISWTSTVNGSASKAHEQRRIPKKIPEDLRDRMVSARSLQNSRPLTLLALVLAQADAREAWDSE
ncbi:hypothetical protein IV203_018016 [Nitzschia inconspicua]|uniref:Uncharacterized protein n=1 Tax=Nitzschia inconspicua TaxID=303405 RepID=A0A9K3M187_9STRA|nr:hypothetical protein IV203_018016 [Nitzschia inconspicua]